MRDGSRNPEAPSGQRALRHAGFSLIEIIVGLTIIAVLVGVAIPTVQGLQNEAAAREPLAQLSELVLEVRQRAMRERRPYQIVFDRAGFFAEPFQNAYGSRADFLKQHEEISRPPDENRIRRAAIRRTTARREGRFAGLFDREDDLASAEDPVFTRSISFPDMVKCELQFWGDQALAEVETEQLRRWIFQPSGLVSPLRVRFSRGDAFFDGEFDVLTGELEHERSSIASPRPAMEDTP